MILKAIEMQGFKSFPEKTVLNFNQGITAVVGPNGSGKSNISDAVRWVLGEQSTKSLRSSKMEDVIFDGTRVRKAHGFAQVTLRLDNTDRTITSVDEDEVAVTRSFFRSGESEYKINGKVVRLRDIHELFMDTGLGRDGYSLVSQGKVADLISGKGNECREMLEEACGISAYRYRRNDSLKKLSQAEENLVRLRDILTELEDRIGPLKIQSEKAEKFLVLADERKGLEIGLWLYSIDKLKDDLRKQEDLIAISTGHYEQSERELAEIEERIEKAIAESQNITVTIDRIRQNISETEENAANIDSQCAVLENSVEHNKETIERILRERDSSAQSREQLEKEIAVEEGLIQKIREIAEKKRKELENVKLSLDEAGNEGGSLDSEADIINAKLSEAARLAADSRVAEWSARSSIQEIESRLESIDNSIKQKNEGFSLLESERNKAVASLEKCENEIESLNNIISGLQIKYNNRLERADKLKKELDEKLFEMQRTASKAKMLEDLEKSMDGYSGSVKAVINEASNGGLYGIHGTVSKLISMDSEYAVAIETALGNAVQNIICTTEADAKNAINFLKKGSHGRATFQPVNSVKGKELEENGLDDCFGFIGIASDLISFDSQYEQIMISLLGRTVIAEDLDCAISIAKKFDHRFKVVTLDGQVVNAGGSMTGGSQTRNAGILTRGSEIERLNKKNLSMKAETDELSKAYEQAEEALSKATAELDGAKGELLSKTEERIRLEGEKRLFDEQYYSAKEALDELKNEKETSASRIEELKAEHEKAESETKRLADLGEELNEKLSTLSVKKEELLAKSKKISSEISKLSLEIHDADKDLASRTQAMNLLKARLISHEDRDRDLENEIKEIEAKNDEIRKTISELELEAKTLREKCADEKQRISELQKQRTSCEEESTSLRSLEREKTAEREKISGEKARLEERRETMAKEYDDTVSKLFDEYQLTLREANEAHEKSSEPTAARKRLSEIKNKIRALGSVNVGAIDEYKEVNERYTFMSEQLTDVEKSKNELSRLISELTDKMSNRFREQFAKINQYFDETFRELFDGGKAEIVLEDPTDVLESNIDIKLQPPGKNVKRLDALSGGEKGLSAIALLFAILKVNPAPFCIFDEVEAALDDANVGRYAQYVRRMTKNTQFILITHRRGTMEEADVLYGITMQEQGVSKLLELKTAEIANRLGITG